jgi:hypothetical protein
LFQNCEQKPGKVLDKMETKTLFLLIVIQILKMPFVLFLDLCPENLLIVEKLIGQQIIVNDLLM